MRGHACPYTTIIGQHADESFLVDAILTFTQPFHAVYVGRFKAVVGRLCFVIMQY